MDLEVTPLVLLGHLAHLYLQHLEPLGNLVLLKLRQNLYHPLSLVNLDLLEHLEVLLVLDLPEVHLDRQNLVNLELLRDLGHLVLPQHL